jgi:hypothetical protein
MSSVRQELRVLLGTFLSKFCEIGIVPEQPKQTVTGRVPGHKVTILETRLKELAVDQIKHFGW